MSDGTLDDHSPGNAVNHGGEREYTDNSAATSCSNSSVADNLNLLISSVITGFDRTADATSRSQDQLSSALDRLTGELDSLLEDAPSTFIMQHSARISGVGKRVRALNSVLKSIQQRIDNMDRMISAGLMREGKKTKGKGQSSQHSQVPSRQEANEVGGFGGFGSNTTQTSPFGGSFQQTQPDYSSDLFGSML